MYGRSQVNITVAPDAHALDRHISAPAAASEPPSSVAQLASDAVAAGAQNLADVPGAAAAGWREYTSPESGHMVYVNDVTYEESATLIKVVDKMQKAEKLEAMGIHRKTGRRLDEIEGGDGGGTSSLAPCSSCGRKFNPQSLQRHEQICKNRANKHTMQLSAEYRVIHNRRMKEL